MREVGMSQPINKIRFFILSAAFSVVAVAAGAASIEEIDINGDGYITEAEFAEFFIRGNHRVPHRIAKAAMKKYDLDGSGLVSIDEIIAVGNGSTSGAPSQGRAKRGNMEQGASSQENPGGNGKSGGGSGRNPGKSGGSTGNSSNSGGNGNSGGGKSR